MTIGKSLIAACFAAGLVAIGTTAALAADASADDRAAIENLMSRYMYALDTTNPEAYAAVFTEDAELTAGGSTEHGHAEIMKMVQGLKDRLNKDAKPDASGRAFAPFRHIYFDLVLDVDGNKAKGEAYWQTVMRQPDGQTPKIAAMGRYEDEFVKQNGKWLISKRAIINDMATPRPASADAKKE